MTPDAGRRCVSSTTPLRTLRLAESGCAASEKTAIPEAMRAAVSRMSMVHHYRACHFCQHRVVPGGRESDVRQRHSPEVIFPGAPASNPRALAPPASSTPFAPPSPTGQCRYLGAERFNARDEGAQLTMEECARPCLAHSRGVRIYLTLNILVKPAGAVRCIASLG
jgi:hypothetical protein